MEILPPDKNDNGEGSSERRSSNNYYSVGSFHYHGTDLTELRKIAEIDPSLAEAIVGQKETQDNREHVSFRIGFVSTILLVAVAIFALTFMVVTAGVMATLCSILGILAIALLVRVILTGQWSETSWFGTGITSLVKLLGGKPEPPEQEDPS
jgi:hypothetical protein